MNYDPNVTSRESAPYYIPMSNEDIQSMLQHLGLEKLEDLYAHIPDSVKFTDNVNIPASKGYQEIIDEMQAMADKNNNRTSFIGDGLKNFKVMDVASDVLNIRALTTSYTPYQPERSQGTLVTHWIYQSLLAQLTGFEAVNASVYERSTAIFEALKCAQKISRNKRNTVLVLDSIYPGDREVIDTQVKHTNLNVKWVSSHDYTETGKISIEDIKAAAAGIEGEIAAIAFPQVNNFGCLTEVDALTDFAHEIGALAIAVIDPMLIATGGLKPPVNYGEAGADIFVAEGQHLAIGPNGGGPGLGIFGIRFNKKCKNNIRATAGRFIGQAVDDKGRECKVIVLSTREQHIKREKANSNICSNQAYIATVFGAAVLNRGEEGLKSSLETSRVSAFSTAEKLTAFNGVELAFPETPFMNEFTIKLPVSAASVIKAGIEADLHVGVDVSKRISATADNYLMLSFSDIQTEADIAKLVELFSSLFGAPATGQAPAAISPELLRQGIADMPSFSKETVSSYYKQLGTQNVSPDNVIYPLGSCTMKYNPYLNDYIAAFPGFADTHPQAPEEDLQGNLEVIYETQEYFKAITGLPGITTQPLAGAQGELVGIKMFQGYHADRNDNNRNVILIPHTAHGTNPATAAVAGLETKTVDGVKYGIVEIDGTDKGEMDFEMLEGLIAEYGERILGVMVTNPNTSGIFETNFKKMADQIHAVGGLVYMDGANMNAIAGWIDLDKLGVDAVHNNTHKTWSIPHGGGGPGDAFVAVSEKLIPFLPGITVVKDAEGNFSTIKAEKSIGSFHRHFGNFGHKVRCMTYLKALGHDGVKQMAAIAVLSARYLFSKLNKKFAVLPKGNHLPQVMHEFILTLPEELFAKIEASGTPKSAIISRVGKLFLDFGFHAPTVAFPEVYGLMVEPTESYTKEELDRFCDAVLTLFDLLEERPEVLQTVPHFTPIDRVDELKANKAPVLSENIKELPVILENRKEPAVLWKMELPEIKEAIIAAHEATLAATV